MIGSAADPADARPSRRRDLVVLVAAVLAVALTARLGWWQLSRVAEKEALQASLDRRAAEPPLGNAELARDDAGAAAQWHRRVALRGTWLAERTVYLENRPMDRRVGFVVVTPLRLDGSSDAVLVQRGWAPRRFDDRAALPPVTTPPGPVVVSGTLQASPSRVYDLGGAASAAGPIRQNLDRASYGQEIGLALVPATVLETATAANPAEGLERRWAQPSTGVDTHRGYAFQWFALAATVVALYVWHRVLRHRRPVRPAR